MSNLYDDSWKDTPCKLSWRAKNEHGYPIINSRGYIKESRYVYSNYIGLPLESTDQVLHKCDNPGCIEETHLFLGTHEINMQDKINKGRNIKGSDHPNAMLTEREVLEIRYKYVPRICTMKMLAEEYQVSRLTISAIIHRQNWNWLK